MRRSRALPGILLALALLLTLVAGWEREAARRWPLGDHPRVNAARVRSLTEAGQLAPREALFWKEADAAAAETVAR